MTIIKLLIVTILGLVVFQILERVSMILKIEIRSLIIIIIKVIHMIKEKKK